MFREVDHWPPEELEQLPTAQVAWKLSLDEPLWP